MVEISRALAIWRALDPEGKAVLERKEFIRSWIQFKTSKAFKILNPPRPSLPQSVSHVSIFSFTHGECFSDFKTCWTHRFGSKPFPKKDISVYEFLDLLGEISYPHNPRTLLHLLQPRLDAVSLAPYNPVQIDHLAKYEISDSSKPLRLELLGRYPSEAIAAWRSLNLRQRRRKSQEIFGLEKLPKSPKLISLWPELKEALHVFRSKLSEKIPEKLDEKHFKEICEDIKAGFEVGGYKYRIVYAYLLDKKDKTTIDLRRLPKVKQEKKEL